MIVTATGAHHTRSTLLPEARLSQHYAMKKINGGELFVIDLFLKQQGVCFLIMTLLTGDAFSPTDYSHM